MAGHDTRGHGHGLDETLKAKAVQLHTARWMSAQGGVQHLKWDVIWPRQPTPRQPQDTCHSGTACQPSHSSSSPHHTTSSNDSVRQVPACRRGQLSVIGQPWAAGSAHTWHAWNEGAPAARGRQQVSCNIKYDCKSNYWRFGSGYLVIRAHIDVNGSLVAFTSVVCHAAGNGGGGCR